MIALTAVVPAVMAPALAGHHIPDGLAGVAVGVPIGLAIVLLVRIKKGGGGCPTG